MTVKALEPVDETPIIYSVVVTDSEGNEINEGETLSREVTFEVISGDDKALQQLNIDFVKESLRGEDNQCWILQQLNVYADEEDPIQNEITEDILDELGIEVDYDEDYEDDETIGTWTIVIDTEAEIPEDYADYFPEDWTHVFPDDDDYSFHFKVKDDAGNYSNYEVVAFAIENEKLDTTEPVLVEVTPAEGVVELAHDATFVLTVEAYDDNLYELEVDHNIAELPEFSVYASEDDPYGGQEDEFAEFEVTVDYDADEQKWTIDFGPIVTENIVQKGGITFCLVLIDEAGNKWGSMYEVTEENTFAYNVSRLPEQSTYKLTHEGLADSYTASELVDVAGKDQAQINAAVEAAVAGLKPIKVTLATDVFGKTGNDAVRILPVNAGENIQLWAKDTSNNWYDINVTQLP